MNLFSYIVVHDSGFAPNPFWDYCTLACCKPKIRCTADEGDLIVGLFPKSLGNRIVYFMRVTETLTFAEYWFDPRFQCKIPRLDEGQQAARGDNIYRPDSHGQFTQQPSRHCNEDGTENDETKKKDLGGRYVLVSQDFVYYGREAIPLPEDFNELFVGRSHRRFSAEERLTADFDSFFRSLPRGRHGLPRDWSRETGRSRSHRKCGS